MPELCYRLVIAIAVLVMSLIVLLVPRSVLSADATPSTCATPAHHQFDFWIGHWDVFEHGATARVAEVEVTRILDGCALREVYEDAEGHRGESISAFNTDQNRWHQSWFTNHGEQLTIQGGVEDGAMVLRGVDRTPTGHERMVRGTWKTIEGGLQETAVRSVDGGKTWTPWFDLVFRPAGQTTRPSTFSHDQKAVLALDAAYQAAVEKNDAAAMERFLADDFALVTGSGKVYTKADLLAEARSGRLIYEHQYDTEPAVRIFGDTAVITAKLHAKGSDDRKPFAYELWFSDTYVRTPAGWKYVFGQSSLPLPRQGPD